MQVRKYYPIIYENNFEMQNIGIAEEQEFDDNLKPDIKQSYKNTYVITSNEQRISRYEEIFSIVPDVNTETLEFRKERILNRLISQIPFTEEYLQQKLDVIIGKNTNPDFTPGNVNNTQWYYDIDYNNYELDIYVSTPGRSWYNELVNLCQNIIPCNIDWEIHIYQATWQAVKEHFATWGDVASTCDTWGDVLNGEWLV